MNKKELKKINFNILTKHGQDIPSNFEFKQDSELCGTLSNLIENFYFFFQKFKNLLELFRTFLNYLENS